MNASSTDPKVCEIDLNGEEMSNYKSWFIPLSPLNPFCIPGKSTCGPPYQLLLQLHQMVFLCVNTHTRLY